MIILGVIGGPEIVIVALIVLLLFGGKKLPELMKGLGKGINEFKKATNSIKEEIESVNPVSDIKKELNDINPVNDIKKELDDINPMSDIHKITKNKKIK